MERIVDGENCLSSMDAAIMGVGHRESSMEARRQ
jgi:hypothetical protein